MAYILAELIFNTVLFIKFMKILKNQNIFSFQNYFTQYGRGILALFRLDNRQVARKHP